jgi:hypothetical protein
MKRIGLISFICMVAFLLGACTGEQSSKQKETVIDTSGESSEEISEVASDTSKSSLEQAKDLSKAADKALEELDVE